MDGHHVGNTERAAEHLDPVELGPDVERFSGYVAEAGSGEDKDAFDVAICSAG